MTTLEELSRKHGTIFIEENSPGADRVAFTFEELRALIKDVVGEPVAYSYDGDAQFDGNNWHTPVEVTTSKQVAQFKSGTVKRPTPLHAVRVTL